MKNRSVSDMWWRFSNPQWPNASLEVVYRLSQECALPRHWSYADPFEVDYERGVVMDLRAEGAQVWDSLTAVARALAGEDMDGFYEADEYPVILVLHVSDTRYAGGQWSYITEADLWSAERSSSKAFLRAVADWLGAEETDETLELLHEAIEEDGDEAVERDLAALLVTTPCRVRWIETLPKSYFVRGAPAQWPTVTE